MIKQFVSSGITRLNPLVIATDEEVILEGQILFKNQIPFFVTQYESSKGIDRVARLPNYVSYPYATPVEFRYVYTILPPNSSTPQPTAEEIKIFNKSTGDLIIEIENPCIVRSIYRQLDLDTSIIESYVDQFPDPSNPRLVEFSNLRTHQLYTLDNTLRVVDIISREYELKNLNCIKDQPSFINYYVISLLDLTNLDWLNLTYSDYFYPSYTKTSPRLSWLGITYTQLQYIDFIPFLDLEL